MIYQDLDGCLADFEKGVFDLTGKYPKDFAKQGDMWKKLAYADGFYANLDWMPDGKELWEFVKPHNPTILTGVPWGNWAKGQKTVWCGNNLGWDVPVITGWTRDKHTHCNPGDILIDDREKTMAAWEEAGGYFILHKNTKDTIAELIGLFNV